MIMILVSLMVAAFRMIFRLTTVFLMVVFLTTAAFLMMAAAFLMMILRLMMDFKVAAWCSLSFGRRLRRLAGTKLTHRLQCAREPLSFFNL